MRRPRQIAFRVLAVVWFLALLPAAPGAEISMPAPPRGGRVGWARMITPSPYWQFHSDRDATLSRFIREETSLNIDPTWYAVEPAELDQLCAYPFVYAKDLTYVPSGEQRSNVAQYIHRGGFLCIDACFTKPRTPDMDAYFRANRAILQEMVPDGDFRPIPPTHAIYHCYFAVQPADLYTPDLGPTTLGETRGLYGMFDGDRLVAVVSLYGLECGWPEAKLRAPGCMKMIVNIYVYAMTRGRDAP